jgi:hypothetical protein
VIGKEAKKDQKGEKRGKEEKIRPVYHYTALPPFSRINIPSNHKRPFAYKSKGTLLGVVKEVSVLLTKKLPPRSFGLFHQITLSY